MWIPAMARDSPASVALSAGYFGGSVRRPAPGLRRLANKASRSWRWLDRGSRFSRSGGAIISRAVDKTFMNSSREDFLGRVRQAVTAANRPALAATLESPGLL